MLNIGKGVLAITWQSFKKEVYMNNKDEKISIATRIMCLIIGWNSRTLKECSEVSFSMLKKYFAAVSILSIIWGVIGWCLADDYFNITSWYGKIITAGVFIALIIFIERYIIHTQDVSKVKYFRIGLAVLMALIGSTVFDQIMFKNDVSVKMVEIRTEQIKKEVPNRTLLIENEIKDKQNSVDTLTKFNQNLYDEIAKQPTIPQISTSTTRRQAGTDENGNPKYETDRTITQSSAPNPKIEQAQQNEIILQDYRTQIKELQNRKLNVEIEVRNEFDKKRTGFLEELGALFSLLGSNVIMLVFYIIVFLFLMFLELLVITTKGNDKSDYEVLIEFQKRNRITHWEALQKEQKQE